MGISYKLSNNFPKVHSCLSTIIQLFLAPKIKSNWKNDLHRKLKENNRIKNRFLILGSGESINNLNDEFWEFAINNFTTIGIGNWIYHDFVPDITSVELDSEDTSNYEEWMSRIKEKKIAYAENIFVVKVLNRQIEESVARKVDLGPLRNSFIFPSWFKAPSGSVKTFDFFCSTIYKCLNKLGIKSIPSSRSNVVFSVFLAKELGAKEVVLAGVDGYGGYFYNKYLSNDVLAKRPELTRKIQRGSDQSHGIPTIPQIMKSIDSYIIPIRFIGNSLLKDYLEEFKEYLNE